MFWLSTLVVFSSLKLLLCAKDFSLVVTALFYTDQYARMMLISGPVPKKAVEIIERDIVGVYGSDVGLKIKPVYRNPRWVPVQDDFLNTLKGKYPTMHAVSIDKEDSDYIIKDMRKYLEKYVVEETLKKRNSVVEKLFGFPGRRANVTAVAELKDKGLKPAPYNFIPNDIYYAVEKKCANWAPRCDRQSMSILDAPSYFFNPPTLVLPQVARWFP